MLRSFFSRILSINIPYPWLKLGAGALFIFLLGLLFLFFFRYLLNKIIYYPLHFIGSERKKLFYQKKIREMGLLAPLLHMFLALYLLWVDSVFSLDNLLSLYGPVTIVGLTTAYLIYGLSSFFVKCLEAGLLFYKTQRIAEKISLDVFVHILKLVVWLSCLAGSCSYIFNIQARTLVSSVTAAAALLIFIFKEYVIGFIFSIQVALQDLVRIGDWITVPKYKADGTVEAITITAVHVRNFDKTLTFVPTYALFFEGFQNWQAMKKSGGRRIKRSFPINQHSVQLFDKATCQKRAQTPQLNGFSFTPSAHLTSNLTLFRAYVVHYLKQHPGIHETGFTFLVRQLSPTPCGLPLEIYVFTKTTNWIAYERIQSEITEHIYAVLPLFDLEIYQYQAHLSSLPR